MPAARSRPANGRVAWRYFPRSAAGKILRRAVRDAALSGA